MKAPRKCRNYENCFFVQRTFVQDRRLMSIRVINAFYKMGLH